MYVDWEYYKIFYYVAKYQNFTKAARVLGNNQPNITHSMNRLESQLNCVLFIRSNRGVTLTPEGEMLYSRIASAAVQIQDAEEELSASATLEHGAICISATETALNIYLSEKLRAFHTEYPGIRLRISNHSTPQALQAVKNGEVDFAIISTPAEVEPGLKLVELKSFYEVLVGGRTFTALANRGVTLTPEGEMLYSRIASAAVQIQDAEEELSASATLEHGAICISATETALNIYLSEKLRAFHTEYPGIRLRISNHSTPQALQAVKNGEVDFAIISTPAEVEPGLKLVELKSFYEVLVGGRTFTALASQSLTLKELSNYPLISLSDESMTRSFYRQFFLDHDAVLRPDTEAATTDQMLTLVKSELGLAFVPEPMAKDLLARGELVQLHLQEIIPTRSICLVYDHHRPLNTAARKFQQMMTKADSPRPAASKQTESISFISQ